MKERLTPYSSHLIKRSIPTNAPIKRTFSGAAILIVANISSQRSKNCFSWLIHVTSLTRIENLRCSVEVHNVKNLATRGGFFLNCSSMAMISLDCEVLEQNLAPVHHTNSGKIICPLIMSEKESPANRKSAPKIYLFH